MALNGSAQNACVVPTFDQCSLDDAFYINAVTAGSVCLLGMTGNILSLIVLQKVSSLMLFSMIPWVDYYNHEKDDLTLH